MRTLNYIILVAAVFSLSGCVTGGAGTPQKRKPALLDDGYTAVIPPPDNHVFVSPTKGSSEELLAAKGNWNLVEQGVEDDPTQVHLKARQNVNPHDKSKNDNLTAQFDPNAQSGRDGKLRVLRLVGKSSRDLAQEDIALGLVQTGTPAVIQPTQAVTTPELAKKIREKLRNVPLPPAKPAGYSSGTIVENDPAAPSAQNARLSSIKPPPVPARKLMPALTPDGLKIAQATSTRLFDVIPPQRPQSQVIVKITGVQDSVYDGKTRIELDMGTVPVYKAAVDDVRNVLRVQIENASWTIKQTGAFSAEGLGSYVARHEEDGSVMFEVRLKNPARLLAATIERAGGASFGARMVIDLDIKK